MSNGRQTESALREALALRVERGSLREVAEEVGLTHGGLRKFLAGSHPRASTMGKLLAWFSAQKRSSDSSLTASQALTLIDALLRDISPAKRKSVRVEILEVLERAFGADATKPTWLKKLSREVHKSAGTKSEVSE